jgi:hypothetical protein
MGAMLETMEASDGGTGAMHDVRRVMQRGRKVVRRSRPEIQEVNVVGEAGWGCVRGARRLQGGLEDKKSETGPVMSSVCLV